MVSQLKESNIHIRVFSSGFCTGNNRHIHRGEGSWKLIFPAIWAAIRHPGLGNILFDTGYTGRFFEATRRFPELMYRWITPVTIPEKEACIQKLRDHEIDPASIDHIVISHFHADHIGGLRDFQSGKIWCQKSGMDQIVQTRRVKGVSKALLKSLLPENLPERATHPESGLQEEVVDGLFCWKWDKNIWFVDLPGHARGHTGLYVKGSNLGDVLFIADATYSAHAYIDKVYPSRLISIISDGYQKLVETIDHVHRFHLENPKTLIIPTHCMGTLEKIQSD